jgi:hypothetical protein
LFADICAYAGGRYKQSSANARRGFAGDLRVEMSAIGSKLNRKLFATNCVQHQLRNQLGHEPNTIYNWYSDDNMDACKLLNRAAMLKRLRI